MKFAHPAILYFLFALALPVIIHLLKLRRYKREYFSNVRLLEQLRQEQKRSSRLRELLVLASRMLVMASVVLAFARPYIPAYEGQKTVGSQTCVSIYLDNSFSMQAPSRDAVLLDKAKTQVEEILDGFAPDAAVQFFTNDFSGEQMNFRTPEAIRQALKEVDYSPVPRSFARICDFQQRAFEVASIPPFARLCYYVSDFQKSTWGDMTGDSLTRRVLVPVTGIDYDNLSLDSLALDMPVLQAGRDMGLSVFLTNRSEREQLQVPLRLYVNDIQTGVYPVDCKAGEKVSLRLPFKVEAPGLYNGFVEIADYPVDFDNRLYFSLQVNSRAGVLHIVSDASSFTPSIPRLFSGDSSFNYRRQTVAAIDYEALPAQNLIILDGVGAMPSALSGALAAYVKEGGSVAVIPDADNSFIGRLLGAAYGESVEEERRIRHINSSHPVFALALEAKPGENLLPQVKSFRRLPESRTASAESLLSFSAAGTRPQEDFLRVYSVDKGLLYLFASPLSEANTDFCRHYTFVVAFLNMALFQGSGPKLYYTAGTEEGLFFPAARVHGRATEKGGEPRYYIGNLMPLVRKIGSEIVFYTYGQIQREGNYTLRAAAERAAADLQSAASDTAILGLSFNYDRSESEKACFTPRELEKRGGFLMLNPDKIPLSKSVQELNKGRELWKLFVILALVFALCETILLRWKIF